MAVALPLSDHGVVGDPFPNCPTWPTWWSDDVRQLHPQVVGLVIGFWEVMDRVVDGRWQHLGDPGYDAYETAQLDRAVAVLSSGGARVALFTAPYFHTGEQPDGSPWPQDDPARVDRLNQLLADVARRHPGVVSLVPLNRFLDPQGRFTWTLDGRGRLPGAPDPAAAGRARPALTDSLVRGREPAGPGCDGRIS